MKAPEHWKRRAGQLKVEAYALCEASSSTKNGAVARAIHSLHMPPADADARELIGRTQAEVLHGEGWYRFAAG